MLKDRFGNELAEGDHLVCQVGDQMLSGTVQSITEGYVQGIGGGMGKKPQALVTPGKLTVVFQYEYLWNPEMGDYMLTVAKVVVPPEDKPGKLIRH